MIASSGSSPKIVAIGVILLLMPHAIFADTLYKKKAAVAIGYGKTVKSKIDWEDCAHTNKKQYVKPPYAVGLSDNCKLRAEQFGLRPDGKRYVASDPQVASLYFPDAKKGEFIDFQNDAEKGLLLLTYRVRSLRLPYKEAPTTEQLIWNEISVADGFANIERVDPARELLEDTAEMLENASDASLPADFIMDTSVSLLRIKPKSPKFSAASHSSLLRLAHLRTTLEPIRDVPQRGQNPGCEGIAGEDRFISGNVYRFGIGNPCGLALAPGPNGEVPQRVYIGDSFVSGGTHVLDGITWDRDTFVGARIRYLGGPLRLRGILFIDCTFETPDDERGDQMLYYAIAPSPRPLELASGLSVSKELSMMIVSADQR
jgi:hypothetical protein